MTEEEAQADAQVGTVSVTGGTQPYSYELTGTNADSFKMDNENIKVKEALTQNTYSAAVKVTDSKQKTKTSSDFSLEVTTE